MFQVRLKMLREGAGLSQYRFADEIGVAQSTVGMWESGKREPDYKMTATLARYFDVSIDYLVGHSSCAISDAQKEPATPEEQPVHPIVDRLIAESQDLSEEEAAKVQEYVQLLKLKRNQA